LIAGGSFLMLAAGVLEYGSDVIFGTVGSIQDKIAPDERIQLIFVGD
jgi:hypothetical protein